MDENGDCRDKAVDLEAIIGHMPTISKLTRHNIDRFREEARKIVSSKATYLWIKNEGGLYQPLFHGLPFSFQGFFKDSGKNNTECIMRFRCRDNFHGDEYSINTHPRHKPEYVFLYEKIPSQYPGTEDDSMNSVGLYLSTTYNGETKINVLLIKKLESIECGNPTIVQETYTFQKQ